MGSSKYIKLTIIYNSVNSPVNNYVYSSYHLEYSGYFQQHSQETNKDQNVCNVKAKL